MSDDDKDRQQFGKGNEVEKNTAAKLGLDRSFTLKSAIKAGNSNKEFKKIISFNDFPDSIYYPSITSDGIFWIDEIKFIQKMQQKSNIYCKSSKKKLFIDVLANVLARNFRMIAKT